MADNKANVAWRELFQKYGIPETVKAQGQFPITADQIKEFREPRLMAKWDSSEDLPQILRSSGLNLLPRSRSAYLISDYQLYQQFPKTPADELEYVPTRPYESIDFDNITSESNAINAMLIAGILDDFLGVSQNETVETFNGRMGSGPLDFYVNRINGSKAHIITDSTQLEIDGGFENDDSVIIMEAKNVPHPDFHVRQLYFPYLLWSKKVKKEIRLVFSQYVDSIYHLYEYIFADPNDYSSIQLLRRKDYTFQSSAITWDDMREIWEQVSPETDDNEAEAECPFPQADTFTTVIALMERLADGSTMDSTEIADHMEFDPRQSNYYAAAGEYLGVFEREHGEGTRLSAMGANIMQKRVRERRLAILGLMFKHEIFHHFFGIMYGNGQLPSTKDIMEQMKLHNMCNEGSTMKRRSFTVKGWLRWIAELPGDDSNEN